MDITVVLVPGFGDSSSLHWQSFLERKYVNVVRVQQRDWFSPVREEWIESIDNTLKQISGKIILVGHSCGAIAIAQWAELHPVSRRIEGSLLVAPADVDSPYAMDEIKVQRPLPVSMLPFKAVMVCSDDDPHMSLDKSHAIAEVWGCPLVVLEKAGHVNADSGYGDWLQCETLIESFSEMSVLKSR
ncbi:RBBP9/YdeN family alpha/beta hydrolase [Celerinatantimonas sp. YJH-8]|uniref:RBBP9/YdeN family alpha/beta hydrolase n=1 Tax=Celerinatantimonas sp. YJH-8 TaxID=3228714 RepID=UPI0038C1AA6F